SVGTTITTRCYRALREKSLHGSCESAIENFPSGLARATARSGRPCVSHSFAVHFIQAMETLHRCDVSVCTSEVRLYETREAESRIASGRLLSHGSGNPDRD